MVALKWGTRGATREEGPPHRNPAHHPYRCPSGLRQAEIKKKTTHYTVFRVFNLWLLPRVVSRTEE
jgi:hypothetical protein